MRDYKVVGKESCGWRLIKASTGFYSYINSKGEIMARAFYDARPFKEGMALVSPSRGQYAYLTKEGDLLPFRFDKGLDFENGFGKVQSKKKLPAFILKNGALVTLNTKFFGLFQKTSIFSKERRGGKKVELVFEPIEEENEGMLPIVMKDGSGETFLNLKTLEILPQRFANVFGFEGGVAAVKTKAGKMSFIDINGKELSRKELLKRVEDMVDELNKERERFRKMYDLGEEEENE